MGPILPRYIVAAIIILPKVSSKGVKFLVSPTVAVALTVSYRISRKLKLDNAKSKRVEIKTVKKDILKTARALLTACFGMLLEKRLILSRFLMVLCAEQISIQKVTVLIPPAVPTGEPPINIRRIETREEAFVKFS